MTLCRHLTYGLTSLGLIPTMCRTGLVSNRTSAVSNLIIAVSYNVRCINGLTLARALVLKCRVIPGAAVSSALATSRNIGI